MKVVEVSRIDVSTQKVELKKDLIAEEIPLHVFLNQSPYVTLFTSPLQLEELVMGHLLSGGVVKSAKDIIEIRFGQGLKCHVAMQPHVDVEKIISTSQSLARIIVSACGSSHDWAMLADRLVFPKVKSDLRVEAKIISKAVKDIYKNEQFNDEMTKIFEEEPDGKLIIPSLDSINTKIKELEQRIEQIEKKIARAKIEIG